MLKGEVAKDIARSHINRLRNASSEALESSEPREGLYPDSRIILRKAIILCHEGRPGHKLYRVQICSRQGQGRLYHCTSDQTIDTVHGIVVKAHRLANEEEPRG